MLDQGEYATLEERARAKGVASSYVSRVLRLTLLAPDVVEAILVGRQPEEPRAVSRLRCFIGMGWGRSQHCFSACTGYPATYGPQPL
jgi:hypothetical protein